MRLSKKLLPTAIAVSLLSPAVASAQAALEEVVVTAQKTEESLQDASLSVAAFSGEQLEKDRNLSFADLARSIAGFSYTGNQTFDQELNIRGVTNTRIDAPSGDQSIGIFVDGVYLGRPGLLNADMFDVERVEVIRGPQGVVLGKNVVGGALSIINKAPEQEQSGSIKLTVGDYGLFGSGGYVTGGLNDDWAGRLSFQTQKHDGFADDILNNRNMEDLDSKQLRAQLLYAPEDSKLTARFILEYFDDQSNGPAGVPKAGGTGPWSAAREFYAEQTGRTLTNREIIPHLTTFQGDSAPTPFTAEREAKSLIIDTEYAISDSLTWNSLIGYRDGDGFNFYDQTGIGLESLLDSGIALGTYVTEALSRAASGDVRLLLLFREPVLETEGIESLSIEQRFTYSDPDSPLEWTAGLYYQKDDVSKFSAVSGSTLPGGPLANPLSGEANWQDDADNESTAVFAQAGWNITDDLKFTVGGRYTRDEKSGFVTATSVATGGPFNPDSTVALVPLLDPNGFTQSYSNSWSQFTPQAILEWTVSDDIFTYFSVSKGYKGGGWEDTPPNAAGITGDSAFNPEEVTSLELGFKGEFMDNRMRLNTALFFMDYTDLQVAQTSDTCNCVIVDNVGDAEIKGLELEYTFAATENLLLWANGSFVDTEYKDTVGIIIVAGEQLQRTPETQYNIGAELTLDAGSWEDALSMRLNYTWQDKIFWVPKNGDFTSQDSYGLLDARVTLTVPGGFSVSVWGKNLSDEEYANHAIPFAGDSLLFLAPPRTYGLDVSYDF